MFRCEMMSLICLVAFTATAEDRLPVPPVERQQEVDELIQELFEADFDQLKAGTGHAELAAKLRKNAEETKSDPAARYSLLLSAARVAADGGEVTAAMTAADAIGSGYEVSASELKASLLLRVEKLPADKEVAAAVVDAALPEVFAAVRAEDFTAAGKLLHVAAAAARKARDPSRLSRLSTVSEEYEEVQAAYKRTRAAVTKLKLFPADAAANTEVGTYLCLYAGDWDQGVAMLALGEEGPLRDAARLTLATMEGPTTPTMNAKVGDAWWDYSTQVEGLPSRRAKLHALPWYSLASAKLTGFAKLKVSKRLAELEQMVLPAVSQEEDVVLSEPVDLLPMIDPSKHLTRGEWRIAPGGVISSDDTESQFVVPYELPADYILELNINRVGGRSDRFVAIGLPVSGRYGYLVLDGESASVSGIGFSAKSPYNRNTTTVRTKIFGDRVVKNVKVLVKGTRVAVMVNGKKIIDWSGKASEFQWDTVSFEEKPAISIATKSSSFIIRGMRLLPAVE